MKKIKVIILSIAIIGMFTLPLNVMADELLKTNEASDGETSLQDTVKDENTNSNLENISGDSERNQKVTSNDSQKISVNKADTEDKLSVGEEQVEKSMLRAPQQTGDKTFTVTKYPVGDPSQEELVGEYDTFFDSMGACKQGDLGNQYVITMNKDYNIPTDEDVWSRSKVNIILKSAGENQYKLKRLGTRMGFYVSDGCNMKVKNIILDGNIDGEMTFISENGILTLGSGTIVQNFIDIPNADGPAIYLSGSSTLNIEDGAILQNNKGNDQGGVIASNSVTSIINIKGGVFRKNSCNKYGGVISTWGNLNITGGVFEDNTAIYGGAIASFKKATTKIENATFKGNKASQGGAIINWNDISINNSVFNGNEATWGGAIFSLKKLSLEKNKFKKNSANSAGGSLYLQSDAEIKDSEFTDNNASINGGAIYISKGNLKLSNSHFIKNTSGNKGGAIIAETAGVTIDNAVFEDSNSKAYGGTLCLNGDKNYVIDNSAIKNSKAQLGGGIFAMGGKLSVKNSNLENNVAEAVLENGNYENGIGGAICSLNSQETNIVNSAIKNNNARNAAGVIIGNGTAIIKSTEFTGNDTTTSSEVKGRQAAGGLYIGESANVTIKENSKFINNKSGIGGAIFDESLDYNNPANKTKYQNLTIDETTFFNGNQATTGLFNPPQNYKDFTNLQFSEESDVPHDKYMYKSLLNNYDINYKGGLLITYDANGGEFSDGTNIRNEMHEKNEDITIMEAPTRVGYQFLYWKGSKHNPGDPYKVVDNHTFVAQWNKIPELEVKDATINAGDKLDLKTLIKKACDEEDGENLIDKVSIDKGNFDSKKAGKYTIKFTLTDSNGASVTKKAIVTVNPKDDTPKLEPNKPSKNSPKTSDANEVMIYVMLTGLSSIIATLVYKKKKYM